MAIGTEIRQTKPFQGPEQEAYLNLLRTTDLLLRDFEEFLRPHGLTEARYNALRILRGAGPRGLPCLEVAARMVTRAPDITRLLDGLERAGLAERRRGPGDRRVVRVRATPRGLRLLARLDGDLLRIHRRQLGHMAPRELAALNRLLEKARHPGGTGKRDR